MNFLKNNTMKYHKTTFEKISEEKRERIISTAISEFASNGYNATSINIIAQKAKISIGSLYSYFESKENLFMSLLDVGYNYLEEALKEIIEMEGTLFDRLRKMISISIDYAKKYREINQIYIDLSTEGLTHMSRDMSLKMESITANLYHNFLEQGKKENIIRNELDVAVTSFCLDNIIMMTQFSHASAYYNERMKIFAGKNLAEKPEVLVDKIMDFMKFGLSPR